MIELEPLQNFFAVMDRRTLALVVGVALAVSGAVIGLLLALVGPVYTLAALIVLAGAVWVMWRLENAIYAIIALIALLPFATVPFKVVLTPTLLDLALGA